MRLKQATNEDVSQFQSAQSTVLHQTENEAGQGRTARNLTLSSFCRMTVLGLLYSIIWTLVLWVTEYLNFACRGIDALSILLFVALPAVLAFSMVRKQRDQLHAAILYSVLAVGIALGLAFTIIAREHMQYTWGYSSSWDSISLTGAFLLTTGVIGGICGKVAQARAARSRKNNR